MAAAIYMPRQQNPILMQRDKIHDMKVVEWYYVVKSSKTQYVAAPNIVLLNNATIEQPR